MMTMRTSGVPMRNTKDSDLVKEAQVALGSVGSVERVRSAMYLRTEDAVTDRAAGDRERWTATNHGRNNPHTQSVSVGNHLMLDQCQMRKLVISTKSRMSELSRRNKPHVSLRKDESHLLFVRRSPRLSTRKN
jgi:hypothetical protein